MGMGALGAGGIAALIVAFGIGEFTASVAHAQYMAGGGTATTAGQIAIGGQNVNTYAAGEATASGVSSIAIGTAAVASGDYSIAQGYQATTSGPNDIAIGDGATAGSPTVG